MALPNGVYDLPIDVSLGDREMTLTPTAVETPRGLLLLDVGMPDGIDDLTGALDDEGLDLDDTWAVVLTHQDIDHAGCLAAVVERTDAVVFAHEADAPYIEGEKELLKSSEERPMAIDPTTIDVRLTGDETFTTDAGPMEIIHTPGHTPGHVSCYFPEEELLITADALNAPEGELVGPREGATPEMETAWGSVETIATHGIDHAVCFHGGYVEDGTERIEALLADR
ncbi:MULTISPECIES: MBL fold metallo-hydrolase [unclassified Haladaptatus]|uniref:MBL fold metallo-hydrolase n=1 Tax=unclassified Haladaptatus TaxID=2622732 RepID=UPI00209C08BA|nr:MULTISPECIES: MBL fold metallo-hydrolase [unclassified Haladaptatus]MCO8243644.1 MBL fold metallo-hydrolase [Haladaptatus sp. AB643]MCO8255053.1 MBL fold metallo-hydrolase [Haladaptatus sp. AB618]